jgi:hypothetical protein
LQDPRHAEHLAQRHSSVAWDRHDGCVGGFGEIWFSWRVLKKTECREWSRAVLE